MFRSGLIVWAASGTTGRAFYAVVLLAGSSGDRARYSSLYLISMVIIVLFLLEQSLLQINSTALFVFAHRYDKEGYWDNQMRYQLVDLNQHQHHLAQKLIGGQNKHIFDRGASEETIKIQIEAKHKSSKYKTYRESSQHHFNLILPLPYNTPCEKSLSLLYLSSLSFLSIFFRMSNPKQTVGIYEIISVARHTIEPSVRLLSQSLLIISVITRIITITTTVASISKSPLQTLCQKVGYFLSGSRLVLRMRTCRIEKVQQNRKQVNISITQPTRSNSQPFSNSLMNKRMMVAIVLIERGSSSKSTLPWNRAVLMRQQLVKMTARKLMANMAHSLDRDRQTFQYHFGCRIPRRTRPSIISFCTLSIQMIKFLIIPEGLQSIWRGG